jgi:hypothetical protein
MRNDSKRPVGLLRSAVARVAVSVALVSAAFVVVAVPASATPMWSVSPSPSPAGPPVGQLAGVSCPSTTSCFAVGGQEDGPTLVEHWNGTYWLVLANPNPSGAVSSGLSAVSCPTTTSCYAVGAYVDNTTPQSIARTLIEHWNGTGWSIMTSPNPGDTFRLDLNGVSCTSATRCDAVGDV